VRVRQASAVVIPPGASLSPSATGPIAAASDTSGSEPDWGFAAGALAVVVVAWAIAFFAPNGGLANPAAPAKLADGMSLFALLYIAAQAIERLLEPFTAFDPKKNDLDQKRDATLALAWNTPTDPNLTAAAKAQATLERWRKNRAIVLWGAATLLGMAASAATGIYLLHIVVASPSPPLSLDILATGLVIGGGTKPLHDLISRIEAAKDKGKDPA
jgi:hypothetical protein